MLDAVGRTDWTCLGTGVQLTREDSWWGKGGWEVATVATTSSVSAAVAYTGVLVLAASAAPSPTSDACNPT
eukprot:1673001-Rhodomonas_salina.1